MVLYLGNKLAAFGYSPTSIDVVGPMLEKEGIGLKYAGSQKNILLRMLQMFGILIRYNAPQRIVLIDTYSTLAFYFAFFCSLLARLLGMRYVPVIHGGNFLHRLERSPLLCDILFRNSFTNVVISGFFEAEFIKRGYKTKLIPNGIQLKEYCFGHRKQAQPKILWVRSFHKIYNPSLALKVIYELKKTWPGVRLTMVGPVKDESLNDCRNLVQELELQENVKFTGKLSKEEWRTLAVEHDIFINTTNIDNLPVSIIEAMALGLCIVSTNVGGIPYLVKEGYSGLTVPPEDPAAMAHAVASIIKDPFLAAHLSGNARKTAESYNWNIVKQDWIKLLNHA
jgi:glycosyltransferase involved in cell wall biosynthesis